MRGWDVERPPRWGFVALALLVLANAALLVVVLVSPAPADPYGESRTAPVATSAPTPQAPRGPMAAQEDPEPVPVLAVYGDGYAAGNESGGLGAAGWPAIVAERTKTQLQLHAVSRSGYSSVGTSGQDFLAVIRAQPVPEAAVTVIFGSRNDLDEPVATIRANAADVVATVRAQSPGTAIVVVGPAWDDAAVPAGLLPVRDAVRAAAQGEGVTFVDPLVEGWFATGSGLIAADGISPSDEGHVYMADQLTPIVRTALAQAAQPTA